MKRFTLMLLPVLFLSLFGCKPQPITETRLVFDTICEITIYNGEQRIITDAFELCKEYDLIFSKTNPNSQVYRANHANGATVQIDPRLAEALQICLYVAEKSNGAFDPTVCAATDLWDFNNQTIPNSDLLAQAVLTIGYKNILLGGDTLTLKDGAMLDLGGVAKGYVADALADFLKQQGVEKAIINLGGNIVVFGGTERWRIGIRKPFEQLESLAARIHTQDISAVTSGTYQRFFMQDGTLYHHILNPKTGTPASTQLDSVTVLAQSSALADAASTACIVLGLEASMDFIASLPGTEAVFISANGEIATTPGMSPTDNEQLYLEIIN